MQKRGGPSGPPRSILVSRAGYSPGLGARRRPRARKAAPAPATASGASHLASEPEPPPDPSSPAPVFGRPAGGVTLSHVLFGSFGSEPQAASSSSVKPSPSV